MPVYAYKDHKPCIDASVFIAPNAQIIGNVQMDENTSAWFGAVIRGDADAIKIGKNTNIQDLSVCHVDKDVPLTIGQNVTVGHRCIVHGCTIEDDCLIGMGAVVLNHAHIGKGSIIAAGTVILENTIIPPYSLVAGTPGKIKRSIEGADETRQALSSMARIYVGNRSDYRSPDIFYKIED